MMPTPMPTPPAAPTPTPAAAPHRRRASAAASSAQPAYARAIDSPLGRLWLAVDAAGRALAVDWEAEATLDAGLQRRGFQRSDGGGDEAAHAGLAALAGALDAYFAGGALPALVLGPTSASPFRRRVLDALATLPAGATTSYGALARAVGAAPGAARAVGGAVGSNPLPIVIPCHRVLQGDGSLGGFSGGLERKRWLLLHEGLAWRG